MPYIKKDDLRHMMHYFFIQGCNVGYGVDHEEDVLEQENEAFERVYDNYMRDISIKY
ncbi:hypothetical protein Elgi_37440 [Paenibacillus elgii]|uniref:hypothetical protein n=1 Tax=Paenibacillus elgii TaxID=189691 RepID=UPI002D7D8B58|nr:hypothetical protein Elgi_37440 [Paenibacillus elgii]